MKVRVEFRDARFNSRTIDGIDYIFLDKGFVELHSARIDPVTKQKSKEQTDFVFASPNDAVLYFEVVD